MPDVASTPEAPPARACHECGARLDERQEICVDCGAAVTEPRPRAARLSRALKPLSLTAFAVLVVTSAAYGLTASAGRDSGNLGAVAAAPKPTAPPAPAPSAPAPDTPAPETTTPAPKPTTPPAPEPTSPPAADAPKPSPTPAPSPPSPAPTPPAPATTPREPSSSASSGGGKSHHHRHSAPRPEWTSQGDQPYSAALYDPYANGDDEHANQAHRAVDGNHKSAWTTADHPDGLGKPGVGLVVEASGYQAYSALGIETATPGYSVEIYSTDAPDPPAGGPDQPGWKREGGAAKTKKQQRIRLKGVNEQPQYLLVWITELPARSTRAGISEISLLP